MQVLQVGEALVRQAQLELHLTKVLERHDAMRRRRRGLAGRLLLAGLLVLLMLLLMMMM